MQTPRMPAEWEKHRATWIAWPHREDDWHDKFATIEWVYAEIVRVISCSEFVEILCQSSQAKERAQFCLNMHGVNNNQYRFHITETDRSWLRDSAPTAVKIGNDISWVQWKFNAWAKYDNFNADALVPALVSEITNKPLIKATRHDNLEAIVLEGGAIETNGAGTLLVTEECLQSQIQCRNPGFTKVDYEKAFKQYLGIDNTIWLEGGCEGDDTHGHIDDVARFFTPNKVLLAYEDDNSQAFHAISVKNEQILKESKNSNGDQLEVIRLPMPRVMHFGSERLPARVSLSLYLMIKTIPPHSISLKSVSRVEM
jgi:agmatine deiminase